MRGDTETVIAYFHLHRNCINQVTSAGWTSLHYAGYKSHVSLIFHLVRFNANPNIESKDHWTPLQLAAYSGRVDAVTELLAHPGIQINKMTWRGTALHLAAYKGHVDVCLMLLQLGVNPDLVDVKDRTALDMTSSAEVAQILRKYKENQSQSLPDNCESDAQVTIDPFIGELYCSLNRSVLRHKVYLVLDPADGTLAHYSNKEQFLAGRPPCYAIFLANIQQIVSGRDTIFTFGGKFTFTVETANAKCKYCSKFREIATEWTERISASVHFCQKHNIGDSARSCFDFRIGLALEPPNTEFGDGNNSPEAHIYPLSNEVSEDLRFSDFVIMEEIGSGSYGKVYKAKRKHSSSLFALKCLNKETLIRLNQLDHAVQENKVMKKLVHPFIVRLYHSFQTPKSLYFAMEYCPNGDLGTHIAEREVLSEADAKFYLGELVLAVEYLHEKKIIYRDMKPDNVLLDRQGHIRLADFGLAKIVSSDKTSSSTFCGSPAYLSPEMLEKSEAGCATDVYGLGCILYEMLTGYPPFYEDTIPHMFKRIQSHELELPSSLSLEAKDLVTKLLIKEEGSRPTLSIVKKHRFFKGVDWKELKKKRIRPPRLSECWDQSDTLDSCEDLVKSLRGVDQEYSADLTLEECVIDFK